MKKEEKIEVEFEPDYHVIVCPSCNSTGVKFLYDDTYKTSTLIPSDRTKKVELKAYVYCCNNCRETFRVSYVLDSKMEVLATGE